MRTYAAVFGCKTQRQGDFEWLEHFHLPIEPRFGIGSAAVGPTDAGPDFFHVEFPHPTNYIVQAVIFKMNPLA